MTGVWGEREREGRGDRAKGRGGEERRGDRGEGKEGEEKGAVSGEGKGNRDEGRKGRVGGVTGQKLVLTTALLQSVT